MPGLPDRLAQEIRAHGGDPEAVTAISTAMSPAFIKGVASQFPNAQSPFGEFHVIAHAAHALDLARRAEQKTGPALKGPRWTLLKDSRHPNAVARDDRDALMANVTTKRTARAWVYRERLREILNRKQVNVVRLMLKPWCTNVSRSQVLPMKAGARLVCSRLEGLCAWAQTRATPGGLRTLNGPFQAARRKAPGLWPIRDHPHRDLPDCGQARLLADQSAYGGSTLVKFDRANFQDLACAVPHHRRNPHGARQHNHSRGSPSVSDKPAVGSSTWQ